MTMLINRPRRVRESTATLNSNRVDAARGIIRGVKICGIESRNGRQYPLRVLSAALPMYEGAKCNINHPKTDPLGPRDYQDRLGIIRNVECRPNGLYGDLCMNPQHAMAPQILWAAEHQPETLGLSHNVQVKSHMQDGQLIVDAILAVCSVDLVSDPATANSLFEGMAPAVDPHKVVAQRFNRARASVLNSKTLSDGEKAKRVVKLAKSQRDIHGQLQAVGIHPTIAVRSTTPPARPGKLPARRPAAAGPKPKKPPKPRMPTGDGLRPPKIEHYKRRRGDRETVMELYAEFGTGSTPHSAIELAAMILPGRAPNLTRGIAELRGAPNFTPAERIGGGAGVLLRGLNVTHE